jgi:glycosyltransferase involved in cell wall biosynthesis
MSDPVLNIALVAPPFFEVPPAGYGGIEAMLALLVDGLVDRGHDVTLIGTGKQGTKGKFVTTYDEPCSDQLGDPIVELTHAARVDRLLLDIGPQVIHDHSTTGPAMARGRAAPVVVTSHGPATGAWGDYLAAAHEHIALVAISHAQVRLAPQLRWAGVVHNALNAAEIPFREDKQDFLVWLGRMSPDKGAHVAIDAARRAGRHIILAAKCTEAGERAYFEEFIAPRLGRDVEWREEITAEEKYALLGAAAGFLFPIDWEEPFGMVMIEAMACGTPVLALGRGAVAEVVVDGVTGFVSRGVEDLIASIGRLDQIDAHACRAQVEQRFGVNRMVSGYEKVFRRCLRGGRPAAPAVHHGGWAAAAASTADGPGAAASYPLVARPVPAPRGRTSTTGPAPAAG